MKIKYQKPGKEVKTVELVGNSVAYAKTTYTRIFPTANVKGAQYKGFALDGEYFKKNILPLDNTTLSRDMKAVSMGYHAAHDAHEERYVLLSLENSRFEGLDYICNVKGEIFYYYSGGGDRPWIDIALSDTISGEFSQTFYSKHTTDVGGIIERIYLNPGTNKIDLDIEFALCSTTPKYFIVYTRSYGWGSNGGGGYMGGGNYQCNINSGKVKYTKKIKSSGNASELAFQIGNKKELFMSTPPYIPSASGPTQVFQMTKKLFAENYWVADTDYKIVNTVPYRNGAAPPQILKTDIPKGTRVWYSIGNDFCFISSDGNINNAYIRDVKDASAIKFIVENR